jgi:hypothetical protein
MNPTTWTVQKYSWSDEEWKDHGTYDSDDSRGEGNAAFSLSVLRAAEIPCRLLENGEVVSSDDPATFYDD